MTRREIRDCAFKLLFEKLLRDDPIEDLYEIAEEIEGFTVNEDVKKLVEGVLENSTMLDEKIASFSSTRSISRIPKVNLAILRIAFYEILNDEKTPVNAAISEAVLLSEAYSYKEDTSFINGILGAFADTMPREKVVNV